MNKTTSNKPLSRTEINKRYVEKHKEKVKNKAKQYRLKHKEKYQRRAKEQYQRHKAKRKKYREDHKEKIKKYRQDNREHLNKLARIRYEKNKDKMRVYRQQNKVKANEANKKWQKKKREENCVYKIKCVFRSVVYQSFRRLSLNKPTNTIKLLGCTYEEAKSHMESLFVEGMSWENYGEWHVDHIRPVCSFNETDMHLMNNIHNLQPLWAEDNFKKGSNPSTIYQSGSS